MRDVGRTREEFVNHEPQANDLRILRVFSNITSIYQPTNQRNLWSIAFIYWFRKRAIFPWVYWRNNPWLNDQSERAHCFGYYINGIKYFHFSAALHFGYSVSSKHGLARIFTNLKENLINWEATNEPIMYAVVLNYHNDTVNYLKETIQFNSISIQFISSWSNSSV